jgi:hypothetical protein
MSYIITRLFAAIAILAAFAALPRAATAAAPTPVTWHYEYTARRLTACTGYVPRVTIDVTGWSRVDGDRRLLHLDGTFTIRPLSGAGATYTGRYQVHRVVNHDRDTFLSVRHLRADGLRVTAVLRFVDGELVGSHVQCGG